MKVYRLLRFFLPLQNPLGFGLSGFVLPGVAALMLCAILWRRRLERALRFLTARPRWAMALLFFLPDLRARRYLWAAGSVAIFCLGANFHPYYCPHYIAAVTCLPILFAVAGIQRLSGIGSGLESGGALQQKHLSRVAGLLAGLLACAGFTGRPATQLSPRAHGFPARG